MENKFSFIENESIVQCVQCTCTIACRVRLAYHSFCADSSYSKRNTPRTTTAMNKTWKNIHEGEIISFLLSRFAFFTQFIYLWRFILVYMVKTWIMNITWASSNRFQHKLNGIQKNGILTLFKWKRKKERNTQRILTHARTSTQQIIIIIIVRVSMNLLRQSLCHAWCLTLYILLHDIFGTSYL